LLVIIDTFSANFLELFRLFSSYNEVNVRQNNVRSPYVGYRKE